MTFWLNITQRARDDITRNADWWAKRHSLEQALAWYDAMYAQLDTLLTFPGRHPIAPENNQFPFEIREKPLGLGTHPSYRAIYTIVESEIRVLTVLRTAQETLRPDALDL